MDEKEQQQERTLTDADVDAVIDRMFQRLRLNVGTGVLALAWKAAILMIVAMAYYALKKG
ncbi:hypothetical protein ACPRNU_25275 [Chromobacterium vaccinii]|uniref:hypothetical protein n=1 Tax=Chromobacterium vaccinii TaxID=1108595 RepID=UPI003C7658B4